MKHKLLNKLLFLLLCILGGASFNPTWADTYEIIFLSAGSDSNTDLGTSPDVDDVVDSGTEYVASFSSCSKIYVGTDGVKLGSSKANGTINFTLASSYQSNISSIKVVSAQYGSDTGTLTLFANGSSVKTGISPGTDYTHTFDSPTTVSSIKLTTSAKRAYITKIVITTTSSKTASDLAITNSTINLSIGGTTTEDINYTTSSDGTMSFTSNNTSVATVDADGTVTAVAEGSTTITVSQAEGTSHLASSNLSVTVNVSDSRSYVATGIDLPAAQKTLTVDDTDDFAPTATVNGDFTGTVAYTYATSDAAVVDVAGTTFSAKAPGTATITITATPTGGNASSYKPASQEVAVTVNGTNSISLDKTNKSVAYGADAFTITATVPTENYDGTVTASSSNTNVATVIVDGTTVTVTPGAVGTATITVTAGTGTYYLATASENCSVTVTAPEGSDEAPESDVIIFNETFAESTGTSGWSVSAGNGTAKYDNSGWKDYSVYGSGGSIKLGAGSSLGYATTPALGEAGDFTLTFKAGAWSGDKTEDGLVLSIDAGTGTLGTTTFTLKNAAWDTYETTITGASTETKIKFSASQASKNRFFLDDVKVTKHVDPSATVTLNASGYATYCSEYPLDFTDSEDDGYSAWQITSVSGTTITFSQITGSIKGGQGILLKGEAGATITIPSVNSSTNLSGNKLVGTLAPTYITTVVGDYTNFGLSGSSFVKINPGTIKANKAYLPVLTANLPSSVKAFTFIFEDDATGIRTVETVSAEEAAQIFNLAGQRISKMQKGINIVNGKKVLK